MAALKRSAKWLPYALLALAVTLPMWRPGYILTLDLVFTPHLRMPDTLGGSYLFHALLHVLNLVVPAQIIEKTLLFLSFCLAGVGMHRLVRLLAKPPHDRAQTIGAYVAGTLYAINPFTYDRLMAGQYSVLLGYALLPFFARALLLFVTGPAGKSAAVAALWATLISIVSIHTLGPIAMLSVVGAVLALWRYKSQRRALLSFGAWALAAFAVLSSYWLAPLLLGKGSTAAEISSFTSGDTSAFATLSTGPIGKLNNVLRLQGFWLEARHLYTLPQDQTALWGLLALLIWLVVIIGAVQLWRARQRMAVAVIGVSAALGALAAAGIGMSLASHLPLVAGYREPQKFAELVALGFGMFAAFGVAAIVRYFARQAKTAGAISAILFIALPLVFTPTIFWGARGQLTPREYPADWTSANALLNRDHDNFQTLFLPWHLYMSFEFSGRIIANPAPAFFDKPVIVSDNPEFAGAAPAHATAAKRQLDKLLPHAASNAQFSAQLAELNIKYIILAHDNDYRNYDYLNHVQHLRVVSQSITLTVYRNESYGGGK